MMMNGIQPHYLSCLPLILQGSPKRDIQPPKEDPPVLNLCTRDSPPAPEYCSTAKPLESVRYAHSPTSEFSDSSEVSSTDINSNSCKVKPVRPFKAYPKDPLTLSFIGAAADILNKDSSAAYEEFREKLLSQVQNCPSTNKNMRRNQSMKQVADPTYWEKRKKNNEAAKRSRDARRAKEDEIAIRCAFLEQENAQLKFRLATVEAEKKKLYEMMYR